MDLPEILTQVNHGHSKLLKKFQKLSALKMDNLRNLEKSMEEHLETLTSTAPRAVCHAYGSPPLAYNATHVRMMAFARSAVAAVQDWRDVKKRFVLRLRGLGAAQMLRQKKIRIGISDQQQRMAAEAARMAATAIAAVVADNDADDDDIRLSFEHLSLQ